VLFKGFLAKHVVKNNTVARLFGDRCDVGIPQRQKKKEIPYREGKIKDIGARVGYTAL
jgi:hypothetical protein